MYWLSLWTGLQLSLNDLASNRIQVSVRVVNVGRQKTTNEIIGVLSDDHSVAATVVFVCHWAQTYRAMVREERNYRNRGNAYWVWVRIRVECTYSNRGGHWVRVKVRVRITMECT